MIGGDRFAEFMAAVHGHHPFPWQRQLAEHVLGPGGWPDELDVPTGLGKTSVLDIAVFAAASAAAAGDQPPRRIFFVVDRRLVVDEAHRHAERLRHRLANPDGGILAEVAEALKRLTGTDGVRSPLDVTRMRGGVTWDWRWVQRPDRLGIVTGTVDQIGSRLLFRGYGVSPYRASIDAAMTGADSLVLVDEAHLAEPMLRTIRAVQGLDRPATPVRPAARMVRLSATPRPLADSSQEQQAPNRRQVFDLAKNLEDPYARQRLQARKTLHTAECPPNHFAGVLAECARAAAVDGRLVAVVANTVATARAVHDRLRVALPEDQLVLLTGRSRPLDRERLTYQWLDRLTVGWRDSAAPPPARVLIATQTVEVGANFDVDVLVTESAAWDALVQRIGRVNRVGAAADGTVVVVHPTTTGDPVVYGAATSTTWEWLTTQVPAARWSTARAASTGWTDLVGAPGLEVSPAAVRLLADQIGVGITDMTLPVRSTPVVVPAHLDCWVRTSPRPLPDVPVHLFLHGFETSPQPVRLVWRADIEPSALETSDPDAILVELVGSTPVRADEVLEVPAPAVRAWLTDAPSATVTDLESVDDERSRELRGRPVVRVSPDEGGLAVRVIDGGRVRPGDTIIVPSAYGGCDRYGWHPASTKPVDDLADLAGRGRASVLRLDVRTLPQLVEYAAGEARAAAVRAALLQVNEASRSPGAEMPRRLPANDAAEDEIAAALGRLRNVLTSVVAERPEDDPLAQRWPHLGRAGAGGPTWQIVVEPSLRLVATGPSGARRSGSRAEDSGDLSDDETAEGSSATDAPQTLAEHSAEVADLAGTVARQLGLPEVVAASVEIAARWHDLGKVDPRFQIMLHGGDRLAALAAQEGGEPLAKSGMTAADHRARREAARRSGYPRGGRHEEISAVLAQARLARGNGHSPHVDADLVVHLVAAHHGRARPLLPPVADTQRELIVRDPDLGDVEVPKSTVDWSHPDRFAELNARYGRWGLSLLESIVRLADMACSAGEHRAGRAQS